jgi:hypothetical protein
MPRTFPAFLVEAREREERDKRGTEGGWGWGVTEEHWDLR